VQMCVAQFSYYYGGVESFVNIDSFENQSKYAYEQLSKPLKMDGIQKKWLNVACKWSILCKMWHQENMAKWLPIVCCSKNNTKMNKYNIVLIVLKFVLCFQVWFQECIKFFFKFSSLF